MAETEDMAELVRDELLEATDPETAREDATLKPPASAHAPPALTRDDTEEQPVGRLRKGGDPSVTSPSPGRLNRGKCGLRWSNRPRPRRRLTPSSPARRARVCTRGFVKPRLTVPEHPRLLPRFFQSLRCPLVGQAGLARRRRVQLLSGQEFSHGQDLDAGMLAPR